MKTRSRPRLNPFLKRTLHTRLLKLMERAAAALLEVSPVLAARELRWKPQSGAKISTVPSGTRLCLEGRSDNSDCSLSREADIVPSLRRSSVSDDRDCSFT